MKVGKVSELILNRSVFKLFRHRRKEVAHKPTSGVDATKINVGEELTIIYDPNNPQKAHIKGNDGKYC